MLVREKIVALFGLMALSVSLFPDTCMADCVPSSCGKLTIHFPFRLRSDPKKCGYPDYELVCKNNRTTLPLKFTTLPLKFTTNQSFLVEEISYENQTVRVVDASLDRNKCSIPYHYGLVKSRHWRDTSFSLEPTRNSIMHVLNCRMPMSSSLYVDASSCTDSSSSAHTYFFLFNSQTKLSDFNESCRIEAQFPIMLSNISGLSASDIYLKMLMGFELTGWRWFCSNHRSILCSSRSLREKM
ncbi:hypothetical protein SLEP1_g53631 [Rubroshorea leprosula]|uniref:Wall-associated receptor kinase galacturonan-binding domain-containing protein n=1 Tax=Rubroshorea leprosula TaxID=152421 RepID=A0AAV5MAF6_9ROSI|nr:hypothetical protein SLEP1_g53631 [Rubroshorea leprosula]